MARSLRLVAGMATWLTAAACGGGGGVSDPGFAFGANTDPSANLLLAADQLQRPSGDVNLTDLLPPVGSQGNQLSCVGWAVGYYTKTAQEKIEMGWDLGTSFAPDYDHIFSPAFVYNQRSNRLSLNPAARSGMKISEAMQRTVEEGCCPWSWMPYDPFDSTTQPTNTTLIEAGNFYAHSLRRLGRTGPPDAQAIREMKAWLDPPPDGKGCPFVVSIGVHANFRDYRGANFGVLEDAHSGSGVLGQHAVAVVGYGDNVGPGGSFLIVNSWGTNWGDGGFAWIPYSELQTIGTGAYGLEDGTNGDPSAGLPPGEGNDLLGAGAGPISTGETMIGTIGDSVDDPADWWSFTATAGQRAHVTLTGLTSDVDLDLTDANETLLTFSDNGDADPESLSYTFPANGTYYIKVYPYDDLVSPYSLSLTVDLGETNDLAATASPLALDTDVVGSVGGGDERDWWSVSLLPNQLVTVSLTGLTDDIDVEVYEEDPQANSGDPIGGSYEYGSDDESFTWRAGPSGGVHYILVSPWGPASSTYTVRVSQGGPEIRATAFDITSTDYIDHVTANVTNMQVVNDGAVMSGWFEVVLGISRTNVPGSTFWFMPDGYRWYCPPLAPSDTYSWPSGQETIYKTGVNPAGTYYLMSKADFSSGNYYGTIPEVNELDNYIYWSTPSVVIPP